MNLLGTYVLVSWLDSRRARDGADLAYEAGHRDRASSLGAFLLLALVLSTPIGVWFILRVRSTRGHAVLELGAMIAVTYLLWVALGPVVGMVAWLLFVILLLWFHDRSIRRKVSS